MMVLRNIKLNAQRFLHYIRIVMTPYAYQRFSDLLTSIVAHLLKLIEYFLSQSGVAEQQDRVRLNLECFQQGIQLLNQDHPGQNKVEE